MNIQDILILYEYNYWATGQILTASARVQPEQFLAPTPDSYGSLRGTLVHAFDAEWHWRLICQDIGWAAELTEADFPTLDHLVQRWREEETAMRAYLATLRDDDLTSIVRYNFGVPRERVLWHCLIHVVNHGTQHRSEAATILTNYGQSPGELDFTIFLNELNEKL